GGGGWREGGVWAGGGRHRVREVVARGAGAGGGSGGRTAAAVGGDAGHAGCRGPRERGGRGSGAGVGPGPDGGGGASRAAVHVRGPGPGDGARGSRGSVEGDRGRGAGRPD